MSSIQPPILIISGLSGSGKSVALRALEDLGYYCVDNLPGGLLADLLEEVRGQSDRYPKVAIGIDARTGPDGLDRLRRLFDDTRAEQALRLLFLEADRPILIRRFSETRRRHPLSADGGLAGAVALEADMMAPIRERADWVINTSESNIHQLRRQIWRTVGDSGEQDSQSIVLESFAFKHGVPRDVDLVFDARCLPNPHWEPELKPRTGLDPEVRAYLGDSERVNAFADELLAFIQRWSPALFEDQRSLLTIAIGCTGGQHRSVYLVERLAEHLRSAGRSVVVSHRELEK